MMARADRWEPRRHVASWTTGPIIERSQIGNHAYRVTFYDGIEVTRSEDFTDPAAAQRFWIDLQRSYLEELEDQLPPDLPRTPSMTFDLTEGEVPPLTADDLR